MSIALFALGALVGLSCRTTIHINRSNYLRGFLDGRYKPVPDPAELEEMLGKEVWS